jgi:hypothetical protein
MDQIQAWLQIPLVAAVVNGVGGAILVDIAAFRSFKSWNEAAAYDWGIVAFRALWGAIGGLLAGLGLGAIT